MGKSTSTTKSVTGSKNEVRSTGGSGPGSAYKSQPVEDRKSKGKKGKMSY